MRRNVRIEEESTEMYPLREEFENIPAKDSRIADRVQKTAVLLGAHCGCTLPKALETRAQIKGGYRVMSNKGLNPRIILAGHRAKTMERMRPHPVVLVVQDTTSLDFSTHRHTDGLGPITTSKYSIGLLMHTSMAVSVTGIPLGILDLDIWARDPAERGKRHQRRQLPIEEKESFKWIKAADLSLSDVPGGTQFVMVADREADVYEFLHHATQKGHHVLVRAIRNRRVAGEYSHFFEQVGHAPVIGKYEVQVPRDSSRQILPRKARLTISFCQVTLCPPKNGLDRPKENLTVWAVEAKEENPPQGIKPIEWTLLTTMPVTNLEEAIEKIKWYRCRWRIERFHFTLKSGCRIEDLQLETSDRLANAIATYSVIAWRLTWLTYQAREQPNIPCTAVVTTDEWEILWCLENRRSKPPKKEPTLKEVVYLLGRLGGYIGPKDGNPGVKTLWIGYCELQRTISSLKTLDPQRLKQDVGNE